MTVVTVKRLRDLTAIALVLGAMAMASSPSRWAWSTRKGSLKPVVYTATAR